MLKQVQHLLGLFRLWRQQIPHSKIVFNLLLANQPTMNSSHSKKALESVQIAIQQALPLVTLRLNFRGFKQPPLMSPSLWTTQDN